VEKAGGAGLKWIRFLSEISMDDLSLVGGKNASLGEKFKELTPKGVRIPM
jgi:pyruvate, water dikinase